jgi:hypothetical protein
MHATVWPWAVDARKERLVELRPHPMVRPSAPCHPVGEARAACCAPPGRCPAVM